jgi:hypothetical protein
MVHSAKKLQELSELFNKDNKIIISQAIDLLRNEHPFEGAIGLLTEYFDKTDDVTIKKSIELFMNDLKDQSSAGEVIAEIRKEWKPETISMLISSCWQSGLDYSEYSADMAEVFMKADYVTAIECLTVIEESVHLLNKDTKDEILQIIDMNHMAQRKEKAELTDELLAILLR